MTKQAMKKKELVSSCFGILVIDANRYVKIAMYLEMMLTALDIDLVPIQYLPLLSVVKEDMLEYFKE
ncbi:hypothetical protein [Carnobacterium sp.]|uniref:hypothetical protein n=1 Tax=Carnobacterium sp. TaxID=48221 RepID=UPI00389011A9